MFVATGEEASLTMRWVRERLRSGPCERVWGVVESDRRKQKSHSYTSKRLFCASLRLCERDPSPNGETSWGQV